VTKQYTSDKTMTLYYTELLCFLITYFPVTSEIVPYAIDQHFVWCKTCLSYTSQNLFVLLFTKPVWPPLHKTCLSYSSRNLFGLLFTKPVCPTLHKTCLSYSSQNLFVLLFTKPVCPTLHKTSRISHIFNHWSPVITFIITCPDNHTLYRHAVKF